MGTNRVWTCCKIVLECEKQLSSAIQAIRWELTASNKSWRHFVVYFVHFLGFLILEMFVSEEWNISKCVRWIGMKFCMVIQKWNVYIVSEAIFEKQISFLVIHLIRLGPCSKTTKNMRKIVKNYFYQNQKSFQKSGLTRCRHFKFLCLCQISAHDNFTLSRYLLPENAVVHTCLYSFPWQRQTVAMKWEVWDI